MSTKELRRLCADFMRLVGERERGAPGTEERESMRHYAEESGDSGLDLARGAAYYELCLRAASLLDAPFVTALQTTALGAGLRSHIEPLLNPEDDLRPLAAAMTRAPGPSGFSFVYERVEGDRTVNRAKIPLFDVIEEKGSLALKPPDLSAQKAMLAQFSEASTKGRI